MTTTTTKTRDWPSAAPLPQTPKSRVIYTTETAEHATVVALGGDRWLVINECGDVYGPGDRHETISTLRELFGGAIR